jgi:hypothetical protein
LANKNKSKKCESKIKLMALAKKSYFNSKDTVTNMLSISQNPISVAKSMFCLCQWAEFRIVLIMLPKISTFGSISFGKNSMSIPVDVLAIKYHLSLPHELIIPIKSYHVN